MAKNDNIKMSGDHIESVGKVAISMIAVGLTAGLALIAGAKAIGDAVFGTSEPIDKVAEEDIPEYEE